MDKLDSLINNFRESLSSLPLIKEYNETSKAFNNSKEIKNLEEQIKLLQQQMIKAKQNKEDYVNIVKDLNKLKIQLEKHPVYSNYLQLKEEVSDLVNEIMTILNAINI